MMSKSRLSVVYAAAQSGVLFAALLMSGVALQTSLMTVLFALPFTAWIGLSLSLPLERLLSKSREEIRAKSDALAREHEEIDVLMRSISDGIVAVDRDGRLLFNNDRFAQMFAPGGTATRSQSLRELVRAPEVLELFDTALKELVAKTGETQLSFPTPRFFSVTVTPLQQARGHIYGAVGVFHDVTEIKKSERVRIDFVANVSHELRTPLTAIKGYTDTLTGDAKSGRFDSMTSFLGVISRNVDRLMALVEDLLDLSSLESGVPLEKSEISTRDLTEKILAQIEPRHRGKNLEIMACYDAPTVLADGRRVEQVLVNLIDNAVKYVQSGGKVRVIWEPAPNSADGAPGGVVLRVIDNGPGIPRDSVSRLFERFYRVDPARSREIGGTGLGLAIVKHVMQRHGGSVSVRSEPGQGSEFVCEFIP